MKIEICGIPFDDIDLPEAVREVLRPSSEPHWVVTPNALMLGRCAEHPEWRELISSASMILPDGAGVLMAARRQGTPLRARVAGIDFGERLMEEAARLGKRVFLLGGEDGIAPRAAENLVRRFPDLRVAGTYWGYFERDGEENRRLLGLIRACRPEILIVCLGFPLQEYWIRENLPYLPSVRVAAGLGGSLDVWAGKVRRAPLLWQSIGMEWAWRMLREPRRMRDIPTLASFYRAGGKQSGAPSPKK